MFIVGIAGGSGSGKTTFTQKVLDLLDDKKIAKQVGVLLQDSYYLATPPKDLTINGEPNVDHPDAFDWVLMRSHLEMLRAGKKIESPVYDYGSFSRTSKTQSIGPCKIILFEGIFTLWDESVRNSFDMKFFLHVEADIRFIRRLFRDLKDRARSMDEIIKQYYESVRPMHNQFLEPTKQFADIVVGEETDMAAELLASMIKQKLAGKN